MWIHTVRRENSSAGNTMFSSAEFRSETDTQLHSHELPNEHIQIHYQYCNCITNISSFGKNVWLNANIMNARVSVHFEWVRVSKLVFVCVCIQVYLLLCLKVQFHELLSRCFDVIRLSFACRGRYSSRNHIWRYSNQLTNVTYMSSFPKSYFKSKSGRFWCLTHWISS